MASIPNVNMGESSCRTRLSTTGVFTCIATVAHLNDGTTFIHHLSSTDFNIDATDIRREVQIIIEKSVRKLNRWKAENSNLHDVFIVGGINNKPYGKFNDALSSIKNNFSNITPISSRVNCDDLHNFIRCIKYFNFTMNIQDDSKHDDSDDDASIQLRRSSQVISDITVISDKTAQPPLLCLAQYFGNEDDLHGGERTVQPFIIYLFDFSHQSWHIVDRHPPNHVYSSHVKNVINTFKDDLFSNIADDVINNFIHRIEH